MKKIIALGLLFSSVFAFSFSSKASVQDETLAKLNGKDCWDYYGSGKRIFFFHGEHQIITPEDWKSGKSEKEIFSKPKEFYSQIVVVDDKLEMAVKTFKNIKIVERNGKKYITADDFPYVIYINEDGKIVEATTGKEFYEVKQ